MSQAIMISPLTGAECAELDRLRTALKASGDVIYEWDLTTGVINWSANAKHAFGLAGTTRISTHAEFLTRINSEDLPGLNQTHRDHLKNGGSFQVEYRVRGDDGQFRWVRDNGVASFTAAGGDARVVGAIRVITSHKQREARLEWLSSYDDLTGHYNRTRLRDALNHALAYSGRYEAPGAYLVIAIDDLAMISDAYGHEMADTAVIAVGQALDQCLRESDIIGRVAPERFGVIICGCPERDVQITGEKILAAVQRATLRTPGGPIHLTASIGGATFPGTVRTAHDAMAKADVALEHARSTGHSRFVTYNLTEQQRCARRRSLGVAKQIQTALQSDRMELAFQPVVCGESREVSFYECLLRMRDPSGQYTAAGSFLRVAEETGQVRLIDRRALELAVDELSLNPDVTLAINISGLTTTDPAWLRSLMALVKGRPDIARHLMIEITETAALHDIKETMRFVAAVRTTGCRVALDDFGAGYTSFRHLKALAVDIVKIDGSFVTNLANQREDLLFVKTLHDLARGFGLKTVAECVESEEVAGLLAREGVDYLQGYHFGKPSFDRPWLRSAVPARSHSGAAAPQLRVAR